MTTYEDIKELIQVGLYQQGTVPDVDDAVRRMPHIDTFLKQRQSEHSEWPSTMEQLQALAG